MKKIIASMLALTLAISLFGCGKQAEQSDNDKTAKESKTEQTDQSTENSDAAVTIAETEAWRYELTTETRTEEEKNDAGVLLATTSYELPTLAAICSDGSQESLEAQRKVCEGFNRRVAELLQSLKTVKQLAEGAQEQYNEMGEDFRKNFPTHCEELRVSAHRQSGDLLEVSFQTYGFWGGAHGGSSFYTWHYDLAEGAFVELADLTDRPEALNQMIANEIIDAIGKENDPDNYFEDYAETIRAKDRFEVSFGTDSMNVGFEQYEIAPYAAGMPSFQISYEKLASFLNERGQRLLAALAAFDGKTTFGGISAVGSACINPPFPSAASA